MRTPPSRSARAERIGTFSKLLNKAVYDGGQLPAIAFGRLRHRKSSIRKELCERRTLGTHALNCPPAKSQNEKVPIRSARARPPGGCPHMHERIIAEK